MQSGQGWLSEIYYEAGGASGRIHCPEGLIPAPGQYVAADEAPEGRQSASILMTALFAAGPAENGFKFAGSIPPGWKPGTRLALRGPLGRGFQLPPEARRVGLVAFDHSPARLAGLIPEALAQGAAVTLLCTPPLPELPEEIEIQPLEALAELQQWADFIAADLARESIGEFRGRLGRNQQVPIQALVRAPMPCAAMAECGACAVRSGRTWRMTCKDGPVFSLRELGEG